MSELVLTVMALSLTSFCNHLVFRRDKVVKRVVYSFDAIEPRTGRWSIGRKAWIAQMVKDDPVLIDEILRRCPSLTRPEIALWQAQSESKGSAGLRYTDRQQWRKEQSQPDIIAPP